MSDCLELLLNPLYYHLTDKYPSKIIPLTAQGSQRKYYRLSGHKTCIGVIGNVEKENKTFFYLSEILSRQNVNVPKVLITSEDSLKYLQEDLGDISLYGIIREKGYNNLVVDYCKKSLNELVKFQITGLKYVDPGCCYPVASMDCRSIRWDLNYFKYCFLKGLEIEIDEPKLEDEFELLASSILTAQPRVLIHRDFQSRNIMLKGDQPYIIDFQGARLGPALYDVVSFLWQSRIAMPPYHREKLLSYYLSILCPHIGMSPESIASNIWSIVIFRMMQVLGAYGYRGLYQNKQSFISFIPYSLETLLDAFNHCNISFPYLKEITQKAIALFEKTDNTPSSLTVNVISFSYKRGYPMDSSGNGGGFIFDCRGIHNPGRYPEYTTLTGNDEQVKVFLETKSDIGSFISECEKLVDRTVEVYMQRRFTHLSVSFGCTGGQHRSVYAANAMALHLSKKYNIRVILTHREQGLEVTYNPYFIKS